MSLTAILSHVDRDLSRGRAAVLRDNPMGRKRQKDPEAKDWKRMFAA
jgi:hypothetical protein